MLVVFAGVSISSFAQASKESRDVTVGSRNGSSNSRNRNDQGVILNKNNRRISDEGNRTNSRGSREEQIKRINNQYDAKAQAVRNNGDLSEAGKEKRIRQLSLERDRRLNEVNRVSNDRNDRNRRSQDKDRDADRDDDDRKEKEYKKDKKAKSNNGNHYGWEKGKRNPHHNKKN